MGTISNPMPQKSSYFTKIKKKKENHVPTTICITRHHYNLCHWDKYLSSQGEKRDRIFGNDIYHAGRVSDARL